jgi:hypothetical protein
MNAEQPTDNDGGPSGPRGRPLRPAEPHPAARGFAWIGQAITILRARPLPLLVLALLFQLLTPLSQAGIFGILFIVTLPALTAGMLQGLHEAANGGRPSVLVLFSAFAQPARLPPLLLLGAITFGLGVLAVAGLLAGSVGALDPALVARLESGDASAVAELDPALLQRTLFGLLGGMLLGAAVSYFAIPLAWFGGLPAGRAIVLGVRELFRQWRALLALGVVLGALAIPVGVGAGMMLTAQALGQPPSAITSVFLLALVVLYQLLLFASQYVSFADCFGASPPGAPEEGERPDQLVA